MRSILLLAGLIWLAGGACAQTTVSGKVYHKSDGNGMPGIHIVVKDKKTVATLNFGITDQNGAYRITFTSAEDSITVSASGLNIGKQLFRLANRSQVLDIAADLQAIRLEDVKITPPKIRKAGDTINYRVDGFTGQNDRTIGEVLRKMPGIEVKSDGSILYRDKPINRFYIEDMDL